MQAATTFTFPGTMIDPWLDGLTFEATVIPAKGGKVVITVQPTPECAVAFTAYDTKMWTEWAQKHAYGQYRQLQKKQKRQPKTKLVQVDPSIPLDLTQQFKVVPEKRAPKKRKPKK